MPLPAHVALEVACGLAGLLLGRVLLGGVLAGLAGHLCLCVLVICKGQGKQGV